MYDIFVSYACEDLHRVEPMVKELLKLGWEVFIDQKNISAGSNWPGEIAGALEESRCVLVVWTSASVNVAAHPWVRDEAESGRQRNILVPLCLDVVEPPLGFRGVQTADLSDWNNDGAHPAFLQCVEAIRIKIAQEPQQLFTAVEIHKSVHPGDLVQKIQKIMLLLDNPATIPDALELIESLQLIGSERFLFNQKRLKFLTGMTDYEKGNWIGEMKSFVRSIQR